MYDVIDRPVDRLGRFERTTLAAIRRWVHALTLAGPASASGGDRFGEAMRLIDRGTSEDLAIGRPCQPTVGESEAVLIALWRLVGAGDSGALGTAAMLVDEQDAAPLVAAIRASLG